MSNTIIKNCTIADLEAQANFTDLLEEYADGAALKGLPHPKAKTEIYKQLEAIGILNIIAAFYGELLIGFLNLIMTPNPHYGISVAATESIFVSKSYRKTGAGLMLLRAGEQKAIELGSLGILVSAPFGSAFSQVLPNVGYSEANQVFFKSLKNV